MGERQFPPTKQAYRGRRRAEHIPERIIVEGKTLPELLSARLPTEPQKAALGGSFNTPGSENPYVTDTDPRLTDARAPTGPASGDLSGTYPAPTVDKLEGRDVHSAAPVDADVLTWVAANNRWEPKALPAGGTHDLDGSSHTRSGRVTAGAGLNVNIEAVRARIDDTVYDISADSLALTDNATNYVYVHSSGVFAFNTTAFPGDSIPLAEVVTAGGAISTITDRRAFLFEKTGGAGGGGSVDIQDFTADGTWVKPAGVTWVLVIAIGGGGGGGGGATFTSYRSGAGGGGGGRATRLLLANTLPATVPVTVGAQTGQAALQTNGADGNPSSFGSYVRGFGGSGGPGGNAGGSVAGGAGGAGEGGKPPGTLGPGTPGWSSGGAGGGATTGTQETWRGGTSVLGGGGGGAGGQYQGNGIGAAGGASGPTQWGNGGGGAGGIGANPGSPGAAGDADFLAAGAGGGGGGYAGGAGGDGGAPGGGGGGGGTGNGAGGLGGRGARGAVRVISW